MPKVSMPSRLSATLPEPPWFVQRNKLHCEIISVQAGKAVVLGTVNAQDAEQTEVLATSLVDALNAEQRYVGLIKEMAYALELCLENDSLSWEAEQEARVLYARVMNAFEDN